MGRINIQSELPGILELVETGRNDQSVQDYIDGHMLGDGSVIVTKRERFDSGKYFYCRYAQASVQLDYIHWLQSTMPFCGGHIIDSSIYDKRTKKTYQRYSVQSSQGLTWYSEKLRWYDDDRINARKFKVPADVRINRRSLLAFFMDDGTRASSGGLYLATDNMQIPDVEMLQEMIGRFVNVSIGIHKGNAPDKPLGYRLYIPKKYVYHLYATIGECPVPSMEYKWNPK